MEYYMLHKPRGCITASRDARHQTVFDYLPKDFDERVFAVGRLDKDTEGLLLLTDDGPLAARLLDPLHGTEKCYEFYCIGSPSEQGIATLQMGTVLDREGLVHARPARFSSLGTTTLGAIAPLLSYEDAKLCRKHPDTSVLHATLIVTEGKKHQVKRMMRSVGCRIVYLKRRSIGPLTLDPRLAPGEYRALTDDELRLLKEPI